jgi:hypothetical protein
MAIRLFGLRQNRNHDGDAIRPDDVRQRASSVEVIRTRLQQRQDAGLSVIEPEDGGADPYNSTGRFLAEQIRARRDD